ncbi:MAG: recombinase family protein [Limisphaerales bacterium]
MSNHKAVVLRRIFLAYMSGESMLQIAKALNADKLPCFGGGVRWTQGQIAPLLRSELIRGILTDEELAALQAKLKQNEARKGGTKSGWHSSLFPNRVWCASCKASVTTHNAKGGLRVRRYYRCSARCGTYYSKMVRIDAVESDFFMLFFAALIKSDHQLTAASDIETVLAVIDWNKFEQLEQALTNPEVRAKLVQLLPNLVSGLFIDFEKESYCIITTDGVNTPLRLLPDIYPVWHNAWAYSESEGRSLYISDRWFFLNNRWHLRAG